MYTPAPIFTSPSLSSSTTASTASHITTNTNNNNNLNKHSDWPLEEYEEALIMNALQQCTSPTSSLFSEDEEDVSPNTGYFSDCRAIFQLNKLRRKSLSNSVRCSICQRRFHSQGNLSNHTQLYH